MMGAGIVLALGAIGSVAVVVEDDAVDRVDALARCQAYTACAPRSRVDEALADAAALGVVCRGDDAVCWRRFLALEPDLSAVLVIGPRGAVFLNADETRDTAITGVAAVPALLAPPPPPPPNVPPTPMPATPAVPMTTTTMTTQPAPATASSASSLSSWSFGAALLFSGGSAACAAAATTLTVLLNAEIDAAARREAPLVDYQAKDAAVVGLSAAAMVGGAAAAAAFALAWVVDDDAPALDVDSGHSDAGDSPRP